MDSNYKQKWKLKKRIMYLPNRTGQKSGEVTCSMEGIGMFIYTVQAMPGQKAKFEGDPSVKYRVKRVDDSISPTGKGRSQIIRENLGYEDAVALVNAFNSTEGKSQIMRDEAAEQKKAYE